MVAKVFLNGNLTKETIKLSNETGYGKSVNVILNNIGAYIYGYISSLSSSTSIVKIGVVSDKRLYAQTTGYYHVIPFYASSNQYNPVGSLWIDNKGVATLYKQTTQTIGYVVGYILY